MSYFDRSDLDARLLRLLVAVVDTGSITAAAQRLGVTQSAVSHLLDKWRRITGDAMFVRSGRGIVATARALVLAERARELLVELERFVQHERFDPAQWTTTFTVAANDLQRDALLPALARLLRQKARRVNLRVMASDVPVPEMLRQQQCQLILSPRPPVGSDIVQKRLFTDHYRVFFDPAARRAPANRREYLQAEHISVLYAPQRPLEIDQVLAQRGVQRHLRITVPGFAGLASFLRGSDWLATVPSLLSQHLLQGLAHAPVPVPCPALPMYMIWHLRHQHDGAHRWLREQLQAIAQPLQASLSPRP